MARVGGTVRLKPDTTYKKKAGLTRPAPQDHETIYRALAVVADGVGAVGLTEAR